MKQLDFFTERYHEAVRKICLRQYLENNLGVTLRRAGNNRLGACCPLHKETTPSFMLHQVEDIWYWTCYSHTCQEYRKLSNGSIVEFIMREKQLFLYDALDLLLDPNFVLNPTFKIMALRADTLDSESS